MTKSFEFSKTVTYRGHRTTLNMAGGGIEYGKCLETEKQQNPLNSAKTSLTGGTERPFRCLDVPVSSNTHAYNVLEIVQCTHIKYVRQLKFLLHGDLLSNSFQFHDAHPQYAHPHDAHPHDVHPLEILATFKNQEIQLQMQNAT